VAAEKWAFIVPGKKFTVVLHVAYSLEDCFDDVEKCLEYEFAKPLTYKVVAVMEDSE
jgi:mRNA-degrading endonuclease HigB of HigAB toxin-antitoxin module